MNYSVFWVITSYTASPLKMGPIDSSETSVLNHLKPPNNPENGRIQVNRLRSCTVKYLINQNYSISMFINHRLYLLMSDAKLRLSEVNEL
jgi:hypothetical protein